MAKILNIKNINDKIENDVKKIILDTESRYRGQLFRLADKIISRRNTNMVLIAGPSCAGKTTSAELLKEILEKRGRHVVTIGMDDFFHDRDKSPLLENGLKDLDSPRAVNLEQMKQCFESLFAGKKTPFPTFDFIAGKNIPDTKTLQLKYNSIVIFEGLHVLNPVILNNIGTQNYYKIYVNALSHFKLGHEKMKTVDIRLFRRMIRDVGRRKHSVDTTLQNWETVCDAERKYITKFKRTVDAVIDTTHDYELGILKVAFEEMIEKKQAKYSQIKFANLIKEISTVDKRLLPHTTLMWEFVDHPVEEEQNDN